MNRRYITSLLVLIATTILLTSCLKDEEEKVYSEQCYISAFSLGTLKRSMYTKTSQGGDSTYTITYSGTNFPMTIDQRSQTIVNLDSLPHRTQPNLVLTSVSFEGTLVWRKHGLAEDDETTWTTYSSSDTLDFTEPLDFRVYSESGNSFRNYVVSVNIHQQNGDSTVWNNIGNADGAASMGERKMLVWNNQVVLLGINASGSLTYTAHPTATSGDWTTKTTSGTENAIPATLQQMGSRLYISTTDGNILESTDATDWTTASYPAMSGLQLVAASNNYLYAIAEGKLYASNGGTWTEEPLDDKAENLPVDNLNSVFYTLKNGMPRLMIAGRRNNTDTSTTIWAKSWNTGEENGETWTYYTPNDADKYRCPMLEDLCIVPYDDGLQALGGKSKDGKYAAMDSIFHSKDHGIAWRTYDNSDMNVDPEIQAQAETAQYITAAVDNEQFLWIALDDKVWRGRINRLGFLRK